MTLSLINKLNWIVVGLIYFHSLFATPIVSRVRLNEELIIDDLQDQIFVLSGEANKQEFIFEAKIILDNAISSNWKVAGIGIYLDSRHYWHLALVEAPGNRRKNHFIELKEMSNNIWGVQTKYRSISYYNPILQNWDYNGEYRLVFIWKDSIIMGKVYKKSQLIWQRVYITNGYESKDFKLMVHSKGFRGKIFDIKYKDFDKNQLSLVDSFGQATFLDWAGKIKRKEDLDYYWVLEDRKFANYEIKHFDFSMRNLSYFTVAESNNIWWFKDPNGKPFFSIGVDVVNLGDTYTKVDKGMAPLFIYLPKYGKFPEARVTPYFRKEKDWLSFYVINLKRRFGDEWKEKWLENSIKRLKLWGFNTLGAWSIVPKREVLPFVVNLSSYSQETPLINRKFPDVFSCKFGENLKMLLKKANFYKNDRYLLGYFVDNELCWHKDWTSLIKDIFRLPERSPAKESLIVFIKNKYKNIGRFNFNYGTDYRNFQQLLNDTVPPESLVMDDAKVFLRKIALRYFESIRKILKAYDPNHLYLGCRFISSEMPNEIIEVASKYVDVLSFNLYDSLPDTAKLREYHEILGKPIIIGEFHFGTPERGLRPGLAYTKNQKERGEAYKKYMTTLASTPFIIGAHWFEYIDQPVTGRFDGENYNIGLVDVCDIPYFTFLKTVITTNNKIAAIHTFNLK